MGGKRKNKAIQNDPAVGSKEEKQTLLIEEEDDTKLSPEEVAATLPSHEDESSEDESSEDDEEDDDLILEGVMIRNPEVPSSDDDEDDEGSSSSASESESEEQQPPVAKKAKTNGSSEPKRKASKSKSKDPEIIQVEFTFCDMDEKFFHGIKTLLHSSSTVYAGHSSPLSDLMVENVSVGTVISTQGDDEGNVYGFASVLNVTTHGSAPCIQELKKLCLDQCPSQYKSELETVLSGRTRRPAGFLLHSRMINLPLEVVEVLHQQLVLDMDWAVEHAEGGEEEQKSLDFGAFVRLAPAFPAEGGTVIYKYFDDEIFATNAEFVFAMDAPKMGSSEEKQLCSVIVMTKTGHRAAMKDLAKLVNGTS